MDDFLSQVVLSAGGLRDVSASRYRSSYSLHPPNDKYNLVYLAMVLLGAGFLLSYNTFFFAVDYFKTVFPGTTIIFDINLIYILTALFAVLLNNVIIHTFSLNSRVMSGYILSLGGLMFILVLIFILDMFSPDDSYSLILVCVSFISLGSTSKKVSMILLHITR